MPRLTAILALVLLLVPTTQAQSQSDRDSIEFVFQELERTVKEGDFEHYESLFHADAVGVREISATEKRTFLTSETLQRNRIGMAELRAGKKEQQLQVKISSSFQDSSSAVVHGMVHYWEKQVESDRVDYYGYFEMYLVKQNGWKILVNVQGPSTIAKWTELE